MPEFEIIFPDMLDADGVLRNFDLSATDNDNIVIPDVIQLIAIDQSIDLPGSSLWISWSTKVEIRGDVRVKRIMSTRIHECILAHGDLTIHGNLTTSEMVDVCGKICVNGSIDAGTTVKAVGSIDCGGSIKAQSVETEADITVGDVIDAEHIVCTALTLKSGKVVPEFSAPEPKVPELSRGTVFLLDEFAKLPPMDAILPDAPSPGLAITPDMVDANGVVQGVNFGRSSIGRIVIAEDVRSLIIDQSLDLPSVGFEIHGATDVTIKGDVRLLHILTYRRDPSRVTIHGNLTVTDEIRIAATLHVTGSINVTDDIHVGESIHCNGSIQARSIQAWNDIFVDGTIEATDEISCRTLTIYSDQPMPKFTVPSSAD